MFIRTAHWACKPECWEEAVRLFEDGALPILGSQAGAIAAQLVGNPQGTERIAVTLWEDEASYREFLLSQDMKTITEMFAHMYVDGALPVGFDYPVLKERVFKPLAPSG